MVDLIAKIVGLPKMFGNFSFLILILKVRFTQRLPKVTGDILFVRMRRISEDVQQCSILPKVTKDYRRCSLKDLKDSIESGIGVVLKAQSKVRNRHRELFLAHVMTLQP